MEHHSNIVPWQILAERKNVRLKTIALTDRGEIDLEDYYSKLSRKTKLLALVHTSNTLGTINPVKEMAKAAHEMGTKVLIDAAQSLAHSAVNVQDWDCDFLAFSGHKLFGPTGIGVLYGREALLKSLPPFRGGGDMILNVTFEKTTYKDPPYKFEAGTPHIAGVIGLGAAIDYVQGIGLTKIEAYEKELLKYATGALKEVPGLKIYGEAPVKGPILSFTLENAHPHDIGTLLDQEGISVRTGHHCTQPIMDWYGIPATTRVSFSIFNTKAEIDKLVNGVRATRELFS
jgi:cysteine desulfurase/selenocysteine lyase